MLEIIEHLKVAFRDNFGSAMFLLVVGIIAVAFIGYLFVDYVRTSAMVLRAKRRHRQESQREHRHS